MKIKTALLLATIAFISACKESNKRYFPEEEFIEKYTENTKTVVRNVDVLKNLIISKGITDELHYEDFVNCVADANTALTTDMDWMKKIVNEDPTLSPDEVSKKSTYLSQKASKLCITEVAKKNFCKKKEVISFFSKGGVKYPVLDPFGNDFQLTSEECGYSSPYKLHILGNGYMCAIGFGSKVDNLVVLGLKVNGTFLNNFKAHKTLQRSFVVDKGQYKEFQDNTAPCNINSLTIYTNKGIFVEK